MTVSKNVTKPQKYFPPIVGVIDTGFSAKVPDIDYSQIYLGSDFIDGNDDPFIAEGVGNKHGSYVLQIIKATNTKSLWLGRAVGSGKWAESLVEFVDAAKALGHKNAVVNLSFDLAQVNSDGSVTTRYELTSNEQVAIEYARQNGVLIVAAAGNEGGVISALGQASQEFDNIITVGAAEGLSRANYSSYGNGLTLLADGSCLGIPLGTSAATARVTGAISQIWAVNPQLSYHQIADILKTTATDLNTSGWDVETGFGLLDVSGAINLATSTTPVPSHTFAKTASPTWETSRIKKAIAQIERPAGFFDDLGDFFEDLGEGIVDGAIEIGGVLVDAVTLPFKTLGEAIAYVSDKVGDGLQAAFSAVGLDLPGDVLNFLTDRAGEKIQGIIERGAQYIEQLPSRIERTANDLFSDNLWNNFGRWLEENLINVAELYGIPELAETLADLLKINTRPLNDEEKDIAESVFGNSINLNLVRIDEYSLGNLVNGKRPFTTFNTINTWGSLEPHELIHELTHVWQYGQDGAIYIPDALDAQNDPGIEGDEKDYPPGIDEPVNSGYRYGGFTELEKRIAVGQELSSFNYEQQARIVEDYYTIREDGKSSNDKFLALYAYFVQEVSSLPLTTLIPSPYGLVLGTDGFDQLKGDNRDETLVGLAGDDYIDGGLGNDRVYGGLGNDLLIGGAGDDLLDGGAGIDTVSYRDSSNSSGIGVSVSLEDNIAFDGIDGLDTLRNIENVIGSEFADRLIGNSQANTILGGNGDDIIEGKEGNDFFCGEAGNDEIYGGIGDDSLIGGSGSGWFSDILDGGTGNDTTSYITATSGVAASLEQKIGWLGDATGDQFISIENLEGSNFDDFLIGDNGANILSGLAGNDTLEGRDGDDTLNGGEGNNILNAGEGNNTVEAGSGNDTVYAGTGNDNVFTNGGDDEIHTGDGNNTINAGDGNNKIYATTGYDSVYAEDGDDLISVGDGGSTIHAGDGTNTVYAGTGDDEVYAGTGDDEIHVGEGNNYINAGDGKNTISAGAGSDRIDTGAGDDTIHAGEGSNTVRAGDGNNTINSGASGDFIFAGNGNDLINAGEGQNYIDAGDGNNTINSGSSSDFILTGNGNDLIHAGEGSNRISAGGGDNSIYAGAGSDEISTGSGNDLIYAGEGNNLIATGTGFDTVYSGSGFDRFSLSEGLGAVTIIGFQATQDSFIGASPLSFSISGNDTFVSLSSSDDLLAIVKDVQLV